MSILWILGPLALSIFITMFIIHIWGDKMIDWYTERMINKLGIGYSQFAKYDDTIIKAGPSSLVNAGLFAGLSKMDKKAKADAKEKEYQAEYRKKNSQYYLDYGKAYYIKNKDSILKKQSIYKAKNKDKIKADAKLYRQKNRKNK